MAPNPNNHKALSEGVDYTFLDGRPVPYGSRQLMRIQKQKEYTEKIMKYTAYIDRKVECYNDLKRSKAQAVEEILGNKLKKKGTIQLKK